MINGRMETIVVGKFHCGEVLRPIILAKRSIGMEILFKQLVNTLGLTIGLRVISCRHGLFNTKEGAKAMEEGRGELWSVIRNQLRGETKTMPDMITV